MMPTENLRKQRERKAAAAGEGHWKTADGKWFLVTVTFYPKLQKWITECDASHKPIKSTKRKMVAGDEANLLPWL